MGDTRQSMFPSVGVWTSESDVEAVELEVRDDPVSSSNGSFSLGRLLTVE